MNDTLHAHTYNGSAWWIPSYNEIVFRLAEKVQRRQRLQTKGGPVLQCSKVRRGSAVVSMVPSKRRGNGRLQEHTTNKRVDIVQTGSFGLCFEEGAKSGTVYPPAAFGT